MDDKKIPKRIASAVLNSLKGGVVPRIGLEHIIVGRTDEINALLNDIETVEDGGASFRFVAGKYGSGKSFLIQTIRNFSMAKGFVFVDADLSPEKRLQGSNGQGLATYSELIRNMSTKTKSEGGALQLIIEKWISSIKVDVINEHGVTQDDPSFNNLVGRKIYVVVQEVSELLHGFEFGQVINSYWEAYSLEDEVKKQNVLKWLRGEYSTKTEAKRELGVSVIIDDVNWYDYLKVMAKFVTKAGYKGLIVSLDEMVNVFRISHSVSRANNYEKMLAMYNDAMQGKAEHIGFILGSTPQSIDDTNRGVFSYEALRSRLTSGKYTVDGYKDITSPIIRLEPLTREELIVLVQKVTEIHGAVYKYVPNVSQDELINFITHELSRVGGTSTVTPREIIRDYIEILNIIKQMPNETLSSIVAGDGFSHAVNTITDEEIHSDFVEFEL